MVKNVIHGLDQIFWQKKENQSISVIDIFFQIISLKIEQ